MRGLGLVLLLCLVQPAMNAATEPSAQASPGVVSIEIGNLAAPESTVPWLNKEIKAFSEAYPNIHVKCLSLTEPNRDVAPLTKNPQLPANIMGLASHFGYEAAYMAAQGRIVAINDFLPDPEFSWDIFYDSYWDSVSYEEKRWGVPWAAFTDVLVCDMALFKEIGVEAPPRTWEELLDIAKKSTKDRNSDGKIDQWGLRLDTRDDSVPDIFMSVILQKNGRIIKNGRFDLSHPAVKESIEFLKNLGVVSGVANIDRRELAAVLNDSSLRYAMHIVPTNRLGTATQRKDLAIAPLPTFGPQITMCPDRLYFCILRSTPEQERACWTFLKWMCRPDISIPQRLEGYPCRKDFTRRHDFVGLAPNLIRGVETIYTATEHGVDLGEQVLGRIDGTRLIYRGMLPALLGVQPFEAVVDKAVESANAVIFPLPATQTTDSALYR